MNTSTTSSLVKLPTFSIILETENLANGDIKGLFKSLVSLAYQDLPPTQANEVLLIDTGDTPTQLLQQIHELYPWVAIVTAPSRINYYEAKMLGAEMATGEVVVYTDSDCVYEPTWLQRILAGFIQGDNVQIVGGETIVRSRGIYGTALAIASIFPPFSDQEVLTPTQEYYGNNVAFRQNFLLSHPIPVDLPLYRQNCIIHARRLQNAGHTIWRQPQARATQAPPNNIFNFIWQFMLIGHDCYWLHQFSDKNNFKDRQSDRHQNQIQTFSDRIHKIFSRHPLRLFHLPLAIPIALLSLLFVAIGYMITSIKPHLLLKQYHRLFSEV